VKEEAAMPVVMIFYYLISAYLIGLLLWNFVREKKKVEDLVLYLLVLVPLVLRLFRIK
jgi:uncharacterized membrane protein YbjE (DUF340 family)